MEKIEGVDLKDLVSDSSTELLLEKKQKVAAIVKKELQRAESLAVEVDKLEKQLKSKKESLEKSQAKIKKIEEGDWSVLQEPKDNQQAQE